MLLKPTVLAKRHPFAVFLVSVSDLKFGGYSLMRLSSIAATSSASTRSLFHLVVQIFYLRQQRKLKLKKLQGQNILKLT